MTQLADTIARLGLSVRADFVPFSKSRNAGNKDRSLNWSVTLVRDGRDVLTTDYSAGIAHCPAYKLSVRDAGGPNSLYRASAIEIETETGDRARKTSLSADGFMATAERILPDTADVIYSLVSDSEVIDYANFAQWADEMGYDSDSRNAETIYRSCLEIALRMRAGIGETALSELREAAQDY